MIFMKFSICKNMLHIFFKKNYGFHTNYKTISILKLFLFNHKNNLNCQYYLFTDINILYSYKNN